MAIKDNFTAEEWSKVTRAGVAVGLYVIGSDISTGPVGMMKEMTAGADVAAGMKDKYSPDSLMGTLTAEWMNKAAQTAILQDEQAQLKQSGGNPDALKAGATKTITEAVDIVNAKASPEEALDYRKFLLASAQRSAEVGKEGAFLGFGGVDVSDKEKASLGELAKLLGLEA